MESAGEIASSLRPADLREVLSELTNEQMSALYRELGDERLTVLIQVLEPHDTDDVLRRLSDVEAAGVLDEFAPDDAADVIGVIKVEQPERAHSILVEMDRAGDVRALLAFLPDTAGGRMTTDFLAVPPEAPAAEVIGWLRDKVEEGDFTRLRVCHR